MELDLTKPLVWGLIVVNEGIKKWVWIKYERLPRFCVGCGILGHTMSWCSNKGGEEGQSSKQTMLFGDWLRAGAPQVNQKEDLTWPWRSGQTLSRTGVKETLAPAPASKQNTEQDMVHENIGKDKVDPPKNKEGEEIQGGVVEIDPMHTCQVERQGMGESSCVSPLVEGQVRQPLGQGERPEGLVHCGPEVRKHPSSLIGLKRKCRVEGKENVDHGNLGPAKHPKSA